MTASRPVVSVILIGYRMPMQLANTLYTLGPQFQRDCTALDYEVVVVENRSGAVLDEQVAANLPANFRYFLRDEASHTPVPAINFALSQCRGDYIGLIMDGARMLSPGVISHALMAHRFGPGAIGVVPGYHLGEQEQHCNEDPALALANEQQLLDSVDWRSDGYELFSISTFSGANRRGYLHPIMECNCLFASQRNYAAIGGANPAFTLRGGGSVNLHMYRSLGMLPAPGYLYFRAKALFINTTMALPPPPMPIARQKSSATGFSCTVSGRVAFTPCGAHPACWAGYHARPSPSPGNHC